MKNHHRVIIIGSGPAGLTAALYAARANLKPVVFEGIQPGGQLTITTEVENYPGFPEGVHGPELMDLFRKQAQRFHATTLFQDVTSVDFNVRPFSVYSNDEEYRADAVIIATGASAKLLGLPSEREYMGYGVSACATCDGFFFKGLEVAVVGGGDTALEEAHFLTNFATKVTVIHRRGQLRASSIMQQRAFASTKISFILDTEVLEVRGKEGSGKKAVTGVVLRNLKSDKISELRTDGLFIAIGHEPNTKLFAGQLELDSHGYIVTRPRTTETSTPGVFAAGDVADPFYRQAITAAGMGCMAALDVQKFLELYDD